MATIRKNISLGDPTYFCNKSWTMSYHVNARAWISFHSYLPNWYIAENNFFYSGVNGCCDDIDFIVGTIDNTVDCSLDGNAYEVDCILQGFANEGGNTTSTTTTTTSTSTTTTTTTTIPPPVDTPIVNFMNSYLYEYVADSTPVTIPFTANVAIVEIHTYDPTTRTYSIPNIGGINMTQVGDHAGTDRIDVWYLVNPPTLATTVNIPFATSNGNVAFNLINVETIGTNIYVYDEVYQSGASTSASQTVAKPPNENNFSIFVSTLLSAVTYPDLIQGIAETTINIFYPTLGVLLANLQDGTYQGTALSYRDVNDATTSTSAVSGFTYAYNWQTMGVCFYAL